MTSSPDDGHGSGVRQREGLVLLQPAEEKASLDPGLGRERWCPNLTSEPNQWFVVGTHIPRCPESRNMSSMAYAEFNLTRICCSRGRLIGSRTSCAGGYRGRATEIQNRYLAQDGPVRSAGLVRSLVERLVVHPVLPADLEPPTREWRSSQRIVNQDEVPARHSRTVDFVGG